MENIDNNMEDFFKKQFNRFDEPFEDWEKPDAGDWEAIASQVPTFSKTSFWTWSNIGLMTLSAILVSSLIYLWILKKEITVLEKTVEVQQEQIERVEQSVQVIERKYIENQTIINTKKQKLEQQNQAIIQQNELLNTVAKQQQQVITNFSTVLDSLQISNFSTTILNENKINRTGKSSGKSVPMAVFENNIGIKTDRSTTNNSDNFQSVLTENEVINGVENGGDIIVKNPNTLIVKEEDKELIPSELKSLPPSRFSVVNQNPRFFEPSLLTGNQPKDLKKQKRPIIKLPNIDFSGMELGYEYRVQALEIPSSLDITELEVFLDEDEIKESILNFHGLTLGIPLNKNWSIQTGIRYSNTDFQYRQEVESVYSTEDEYVLPDGTIAKNINIVQETPFSKTNTAVQLLFNANERLTNGEEFKWFSSGQQNQRMVQLPLGVNYKFGQNKLNWFLGTGMQWNHIEFGNVSYEMELEDREKEFRVLASDTEVLSSIQRLDYFSAYTTAGLQYQITKNWSARASLAYNYHFLNRKSIEKWDSSDKSVAIGLQYTF